MKYILLKCQITQEYSMPLIKQQSITELLDTKYYDNCKREDGLFYSFWHHGDSVITVIPCDNQDSIHQLTNDEYQPAWELYIENSNYSFFWEGAQNSVILYPDEKAAFIAEFGYWPLEEIFPNCTEPFITYEDPITNE